MEVTALLVKRQHSVCGSLTVKKSMQKESSSWSRFESVGICR